MVPGAVVPPPAATPPPPPFPRLGNDGSGYLCRAVACVCPPGQGHNSDAYLVYSDALDAGKSTDEARELAWPTRCDLAAARHSTPHVGCIMR